MKKKPVKIELKMELSAPEARMCDCGHGPPHAHMTVGRFKSTPFGSKSWGRKIARMEEIDFWGEFISNELQRQIELLPLPEAGVEKVVCSKCGDQPLGEKINQA